MPLNAERLLAHAFGETRQRYKARDAILYALGVGLGADPSNEADLEYLDETRLRVLPPFAGTLGSPGAWIRDRALGVNFNKLVHARQDATFHADVPAQGEVVATGRIAALHDRGEGRGAVVALERRIADADSGELYCTLTQTLLLRGDGGFGGEPEPRRPTPAFESPPDLTARLHVSPRAALIYRLSGDLNPLHIDPAFARRAGFGRPILHGMATYAGAGVAVARAAGLSPDRLGRLACRFSGVVYPGDTLALSIWREGETLRFTALAGERKVLDDGLLQVRA